jgi:hypothetical protein
MFRLGAALGIAAYVFQATPSSADQLAGSLFQTSMATPVASACSLNDRFRDMHETIVKLAEESGDAGDRALALHHRSTSRSYKRIEDEWSDVGNLAEPALDELTYIPVNLDKISDHDIRKAAALNLAAAYEGAVHQLVDYAHFAVYFERSENAVSMNSYALSETFNFGVSRAHTKASSDTYTRSQFDAKRTGVRDALRTVVYPEYRYAKFCGSTLQRRQANVQRNRSSRERSRVAWLVK